MANEYDVGDAIRCQTSTPFANAAGTAFDPDVVKAKFRRPNGSITTYVYGTDAALIKAATGDYYFDLDLDTPGIWYYRIEGQTSSATYRGGDEEWLMVKASQFAIDDWDISASDALTLADSVTAARV